MTEPVVANVNDTWGEMRRALLHPFCLG